MEQASVCQATTGDCERVSHELERTDHPARSSHEREAIAEAERRLQLEPRSGNPARRQEGRTYFAAGVLASETFLFPVFRSMQPLVSVYW